MSELKAIIFDVDGTLADTERDGHLVAFNQAFRESGLDWHWDPALYGRLLAVTGGRERILHYMESCDPPLPAGIVDREAFARQLHVLKTERYTQLMATGVIPLRPGVRRLLEEARAAGLRLAIATTTSLANVEALLVHTLGPQAMSWFEVIGAGDVVPAKKPAADIYYYVLDRLALSADDALAIEDSRNGLLAATGAGLKTLITVDPYCRGQDFTGAVLVVDNLGEPGQPFTVLAGNAGDSTCVDLALLRRLHDR